MKRITENYNAHNKDELVAESNARKLEGVNTSSSKSDVIAALELSDEQSSDSSSETKDNTGHETPIIRSTPLVPSTKNEPALVQPKEKDYKGSYVKTDDGEEYGLAVVESDPLGKTHKLRNEEHFWEGTKDEFKAQFEKK